ncbi:MAG: FAD-dependent monooxygenase [Gemmatimonadota bacterium]|nr:FAD-dependent monooxygenase [Gemmatimonadota bacterium]
MAHPAVIAERGPAERVGAAPALAGGAIVVGAGIGGSAQALLLARSGMDVTLLEQVAAPADGGAAVFLQANGLAVLYGLGLEEALGARGARITRGTIYGERGVPLLETRLPQFGEGLDHGLVVTHRHLLELLHDALREEPRITLRPGVRVNAVLPDGGGVRFTEEDGAGRELRGALVVGADGVHSRVRPHVDPVARVRDPGILYVRGIAPGAFLADAAEWWTPLGLFGALPLGSEGEGGVYFFTSVSDRRIGDAVRERDLRAFRNAWCDAIPSARRILSRVTSFDELILTDVLRVDCHQLSRGRVALIGDAAHAMAPNAGQGANSALVDAAVLLQELGSAPTVFSALAAYDRRRRGPVRMAQEVSDRLAELAHVSRPWLRRLRDRALPMIVRAAGRQRLLRRLMQEEPALLRSISAARTQPAAPPHRARAEAQSG